MTLGSLFGPLRLPFALLLLLGSSIPDRGCARAQESRFDSPDVLHELYGALFDVNDTTTGRGGVVVLGQHNCASSSTSSAYYTLIMKTSLHNQWSVSTEDTCQLTNRYECESAIMRAL